MVGGGGGGPDPAILERQRAESEAERKRLDVERVSAEREQARLVERRNKEQQAARRSRSGRRGLITNIGGELGLTDKLG